ncbi:VOC family protein [Hydrogenophaga sp. A37]|uniref:VOC family protein n=1 Tax=Hydrogenophaga sp. A37 TaxID=1945864 RepID=UPI0015C534C6|nr:VOC family protein [Hydrogenophaga sp. A37]
MQQLVHIHVDDLARAIAFYSTCFELHVGRDLGANGVELHGTTAPIYLLTKAAGDRATSPVPLDRPPTHWRPLHLDVVVDDVDAVVARALTAGAQLEHPVYTSSWGKLALVTDPFGHGFCLVQFLGSRPPGMGIRLALRLYEFRESSGHTRFPPATE